jgi:hypothetical protein
MNRYQKPTVVVLESASTAIQNLGKRIPLHPDSGVMTSGAAYDLDE